MTNEKIEFASITDMTARELSLAIHGRKVSCKEVMEAYLERIERVNPGLNAIVALRNRDELLAEADGMDRCLASGGDCGWMHGFPQAIKDLEETEGIVTTYGSPILKDYVPAADSDMVARIKGAGAIVIGKTNTPEWGYGSQTYNNVYGATANPYDTSKTCGGSSGGTACAVSARMQAVADGSDYGGSLRNPAAWCNIYGYRPSWGRVPAPGLDYYISSCAMRGPMARTVADLALLLCTISGFDVSKPATLEDDENLKSLTPQNVLDRLESDPSGRKIAWLGDWDGYLPMEEGVMQLCGKALTAFERLGVAVETIKPPSDPERFWNEVWLPFRHYSTILLRDHYDDPARRALLKPEAVYEYEGSGKYSARDMYDASVKRGEFYRAILGVFENYDYIAVPTAQVFPFDKTIHWPKEIAGRKMDTYHRWMEVVTHWTMAGNPVAAIPAGFGENGLPMGIQVIGRPRGDFDLLRFVRAYEKSNDWVGERPPKL